MYQNKVTLIGFTGNDAEVRTNDNRSFTTLSLATKSSYKKDGQYISHTEWHRCVVFGKLSEFARHPEEGRSSAGGRRAAQPGVRDQEGRQEASPEEDHLGDPGGLDSQAGPGREGQPRRAGRRAGSRRPDPGGSGRISRYPSINSEARSTPGFPICETTEMNTQTAYEFLIRCFQPGETVALLLRKESPASTTQRIVTLEQAIAPRYLAWLRYENHNGANVYVAANPLRPGSRKRTKDCIAEARHLYLDIDVDGDNRIATLMESEAVPAPTVILSTSPDKYQLLWRVEGFDFDQQESTLKQLAIAFGGDSACTDRNGVLRVPGFRNCKYHPAHIVTVEYPSDSTYGPDDFRLDDSILDCVLQSRGGARAYPTGKNTHSEQDWAWAVQQLSLGVDAEDLTEVLASRRSDKPNPLYYAQRTIDIASARLSLLEGMAIEDVIAMLESRRSAEVPTSLCSSRAREIATTAQRMMERTKFASIHHPKEKHHATA
jgi:hypothetical protein